MPHVARLTIAPVRSLGLESRDEIVLGTTGVAEDRRFYVIDDADRLVDQIVEGAMVQVGAWTDVEATHLRLTFPDGTLAEDEVRLADPIETAVHGRTAVGHLVEGPWGAALSGFLGRPVRIVRCDRIGGTRRAHAATLIGDGSLEALSAVLGAGGVDARRFRMLIELEGCGAHEEDSWVGRRIGLGETVMVVGAPVPRCAITTHDPETGRRDLDALRAIRTYRGQTETGDLVFGVYGEVETPGVIRVGDEVRRLD